jgi:hypothetical protein
MNQVTTKTNAGALATNIFEADANAGSQNMTQEDLALPFLKVLGQLSPEVNKQNAKFINGNYLENTANHFVILLGKSPSTALISMKATQLKVSRKWNSMMMGLKLQGKNGLFTPPTYSHIYNLKTVQMSNDKGTWFGWDVSKVGPVSDKGVYEIAKGFAEKNSKGLVKVKHGSDESKDVPF